MIKFVMIERLIIFEKRISLLIFLASFIYSK